MTDADEQMCIWADADADATSQCTIVPRTVIFSNSNDNNVISEYKGR